MPLLNVGCAPRQGLGLHCYPCPWEDHPTRWEVMPTFAAVGCVQAITLVPTSPHGNTIHCTWLIDSILALPPLHLYLRTQVPCCSVILPLQITCCWNSSYFFPAQHYTLCSSQDFWTSLQVLSSILELVFKPVSLLLIFFSKNSILYIFIPSLFVIVWNYMHFIFISLNDIVEFLILHPFNHLLRNAHMWFPYIPMSNMPKTTGKLPSNKLL